MRETETPPDRLDTAYLINLANEIGTACLRDALHLFELDGPERLEAIRDALAAGEPARMRREAHALSGAAYSVGLPCLGDAGRAMQLAIESREPNAADVARLEVLLRESLTAMTAWLRSRDAGMAAG